MLHCDDLIGVSRVVNDLLEAALRQLELIFVFELVVLMHHLLFSFFCLETHVVLNVLVILIKDGKGVLALQLFSFFLLLALSVAAFVTECLSFIFGEFWHQCLDLVLVPVFYCLLPEASLAEEKHAIIIAASVFPFCSDENSSAVSANDVGLFVGMCLGFENLFTATFFTAALWHDLLKDI